MLELKNIHKSYKTKTLNQHVLKGINLKFRENEFVAILGPSGSGKTTLLNIIGGLDRYDEGDLILKGKSTKNFKNKNWDSYRNKSVGFIFQSYNLISHMNVLNNVEMGMTLSGKKPKYRKSKAIELLEEVGLKEHIHKKPNQLSGGQMQRVAIARALANDPEIILADEPTGALDSKTSVQIMELIKKISKNKLVIMVTHNAELAEKYADRIIKMKDGVLEEDTNPVTESEKINNEYKLNKTSMSIFTAIHLSLNNIRTKKGRTFLTAFASSIGIIGIALILSLSNGFSKQIKIFERSVADAMPVIITETKLSNETIKSEMSMDENENAFSDSKEIKVEEKSSVQNNNLSSEYLEYLEKMPTDYLSSVNIDYSLKYGMNIIKKDDNKYSSATSEEKELFNLLPSKGFNDNSITKLITDYYDILQGRLPENKNEIILEINDDNTVDKEVYSLLGLNKDNISFDEILNKEIKIILNDDFYKKQDNYFAFKNIDEKMYNNENNLTLKIVGIMRVKKEKSNVTSSGTNLYYTNELKNYIIEKNSNSEIVKKQKDSNYNVLTGENFENDTAKNQMLLYFGAPKSPTTIYLYPKDFDTTSNLIDYLNKYNNDKKEEDKVTYLNQAELIDETTNGIMNGITIVLVAFSSISLIVSSIMLGIITYISVLERTKEIGVLRSLGARKKDIRRVFNAETLIIGMISGLLGILIAYLLTLPINSILFEATTLENIAVLNPIHAVMLIAISMLLTLIGGAIPSNIASKKDPVNALRTE